MAKKQMIESELPAFSNRVPDLKPGIYKDGQPLHEVQFLECKNILKPDRFTSAKSFREYGKLVEQAAEENDIECTDKAATPRPELPFTLAIAVLLASYVVRIPVMWRQAPITAAVVIAGSLSTHSKMVGAETGLRRVSEVIFGCVVALAVSWLMAKIWPLPDSGPAPKSANP